MRIATARRSVRGPDSTRVFLKFLAAAFLLVFPCCGISPGVAAEPEDPPGEIPVAQLRQGIALATRYLAANCRKSGRFIYLRHLDEARDYGREYNLIRHAGAVFALARAQRRSPRPEIRRALVNSSAYLLRQVSGISPEAREAAALWSFPAVIGRDNDPAFRLQAKLGGTGLALVALAAAQKIDPNIVSLQELRRLARFLVFMQKPDGSFYSKYYAGTGRDDSWTSLYYPGEAMLGLLSLYELDPDPKWLQAAARGLAYLVRSRRGRSRVAADHWALLATAKLLPYYDRLEQPPVSREDIFAHAKQICEGIISEQVTAADDPAGYGSFGAGARTCPASTRLEGLLAALSFLPPEEKALRQEIRKAVRRGMRFLIQAQLKTGDFAGAFPFAAQKFTPGLKPNGFNRQAGEIRIDYVQHALCAMLQYEACFF